MNGVYIVLILLCAQIAPFFGYLGAASALVFSCFGAAYGTAKSGVGIAAMGVMRPELVMKSIIPVVMAGVLGIYGLIIAVVISTGSTFLQLCFVVVYLLLYVLKVNETVKLASI